MPPTVTTIPVPAKLPDSSAWWLLLSVLVGLLLAGNSLRPQALAIASAPVAPAAPQPQPAYPWAVAVFLPAAPPHL